MTDVRDFHLMNIALGGVVLAVVAVDPRTAVQLMALIGATWLTMLLIVPRLFYSKYFPSWKPELERIAKLSKYAGLWVAAWFAAHATTAVLTYYGVPTDIGKFITQFELTQPSILAAASLTILVILAVLSNKWSYAHVKWWKQLNMLVWAIPFMGLAHSLLAARAYRGELPLLMIAPILLGLSVLAGYDALFAAEKRFTDKLRLLYLTAGGVGALVVVLFWPR